MDGSDAINYILNNNIEGVIVECGVASGDFEYIWIKELIKIMLQEIYIYLIHSGD